MHELGKWHFEVCLVDRSKMVDKQKKQHILKIYFLLINKNIIQITYRYKIKMSQIGIEPMSICLAGKHLNLKFPWLTGLKW